MSHAVRLRQFRHIIFWFSMYVISPDAVAQQRALFDSDEILEFQINTDVRSLFRDRGKESTYFEATIKYEDANGNFDIPIKIKTRGHFRKQSGNCKYPPLMLNFAKNSTPEDCMFNGQDKLKLVTPCIDDEYVIQEYLVYKLYNLFTPKSFKARLVRVMFQDNTKNKQTGPLLGILLEDEDQMAKRNHAEIIEVENMRPRKTQKDDYLKMAVFQYLIGNTDWSVQYQQNIKLIKTPETSDPITVPYDFDHAGIVRAPYAKPAPELLMESTLQRRFRGYCIADMADLEGVFALFKDLKNDIYAIYAENPLLSDKYKKLTLSFLDEFYGTLNNPEKAQKDFMYPCDPNGTGNIVIKGLREN